MADWYITLIQVLGALGFIGVLTCGALSFDSSSSFHIEWTENWTENVSNVGSLLTVYSIVVVVVGFVGLSAELRVRDFVPSLHPFKIVGPLLMVMGVLVLGLAHNTGIIVGSYCMFFGLLQTVMAYGFHKEGQLSLGQLGTASSGLVRIVQVLGAMASLGIVVVGIMCAISAASAIALTWCDNGGGNCWKGNADGWTVFAIGMFLCVFGVAGVIANLKIKGWLSGLYRFNILGLFMIMIGLLALGAVGNTGIILGAFAMGIGGIYLLFYYFLGTSDGYQEIK